jgi:hypothetical protein
MCCGKALRNICNKLASQRQFGIARYFTYSMGIDQQQGIVILAKGVWA